MLSPSTDALLRRLRTGTFGPSEIDWLEKTSGADLVNELRAAYPLTFQERRVGRKWEISLARSLRTELATHTYPDSVLVSLRVLTVYVDCVMLSGEGDAVTGISRIHRLRARTVGKPTPALALTTGRGFKLDRAPDGWAMKPLAKRTVRLGEAFLKGRGWNFHHLAPFIPSV